MKKLPILQLGFAPIYILIAAAIISITLGAIYWNKIFTYKPTFVCQPVSIGLKKDDDKIFLKSKKNPGFEAVARKKTDGNVVNFDIVTNALPQDQSPYSVWVLDVDKNEVVCEKKLIGNLTKDQKLGIWNINFSSNDYTDDAQHIAITVKDTEYIFTTNTDGIILEGSFGQNQSQPQKEKPDLGVIKSGLENFKLVSYSLKDGKTGFRLMDTESTIKDFGEYLEGSLSHDHSMVALVSLSGGFIYDSSGNLISKTLEEVRGVSSPSWSSDDQYAVFGAITPTGNPGNNNYATFLFDNQNKKWSGAGLYGIENCNKVCKPSPVLFSPVEYKYLMLTKVSDKTYLSIMSRDTPKTQFSSGCPWVCGETRYQLDITDDQAKSIDYKWSGDGQKILYKLAKDQEYTEVPLTDFK